MSSLAQSHPDPKETETANGQLESARSNNPTEHRIPLARALSPPRPLTHSPSHILLTLLPNLYIQQHTSMHPHSQILFQAIIPARGLPRFGIERERERLAKRV